jgi:hypothetical protein
MSDEPLTVEEWVETLKRKAERKGLTADELTPWLLININDRLVEIQQSVGELDRRYRLLDHWLEDTAPGYRAPKHLTALKKG